MRAPRRPEGGVARGTRPCVQQIDYMNSATFGDAFSNFLMKPLEKNQEKAAD